MSFSLLSLLPVCDFHYVHRFWLYLVYGFLIFFLDAFFTTKQANVDPSEIESPSLPFQLQGQTAAALVCWTLYGLLLLRAYHVRTGISYRDSSLFIEMLIVVGGWWLLELLHTEVFQVYWYKIPTQSLRWDIRKGGTISSCSESGCYRPVPLFVPPGHWLAYDWTCLLAEKIAAWWRGESPNLGSEGLDAFFLEKLRPRILDDSKFGLSNRTTFLVCASPLLVAGFYSGVVSEVSRIEVLVLVPMLFIIISTTTLQPGQNEQFGNGHNSPLADIHHIGNMHSDILTKLYAMLVVEILGVNVFSCWRWQDEWPPSCERLRWNHDYSQLWYWWCDSNLFSAGNDPGPLLTLRNPPWLIGAGYIAVQGMLRVITRKIWEQVGRTEAMSSKDLLKPPLLASDDLTLSL